VNVLFAASEISPYAKTGGLGDVLSSLPAALQERGHSVSCVLPFYRGVSEKLPGVRRTEIRIMVPLGPSHASAVIWEAVASNGVRIFLVQRDEYYDRSSLYGVGADYEDNAARFIFFSKVAVELVRYIDPLPQIIHAHDWQTGLIPAFVRARNFPQRTVYTIHNLAYQGDFWGVDFGLTNLAGEYFTPPGVEFHGRLNCMKAAITLAQQITTVSPRYAEEIQTPFFGCGLDAVLRENRYKLTGILNGIDDEAWNPAKDPFLPHPFSSKSLKGKEEMKTLVLGRFGLKETDAPLFCSISRLAGQKGFDLLGRFMEEFLQQDVRFLLLGSGDPVLQDFFTGLARRFPEKVGVEIGFNEGLAHQLEAGADFFFMPSAFEPCGLNQMYSQVYGTLPIVHRVGGLVDSVTPYGAAGDEATGFAFNRFDVEGIRTATEEALTVYRDKTRLKAMRSRAMKQNFSWTASAAAYEKVYEAALLR
jgi:starch synthase